MKRNIFFVGILFFISCAGNNRQDDGVLSEQKLEIIHEDTLFNICIDKFTVIPDEIDGCGCYFFISKEDEKSEQYIYVNNFAHLAFMMINGEMVEFELSEHNENNDIYLYKHKNIKLKVEITKKEFDEYEISNVEGVITIETEKNIKKQSFVGNCGC
ncbi:MAG: hypothetical protein FWH36_05070 [Lentimicrobiaceae bacterium]|nr:hypothetical protein [Lentimicrobiaceae bacterium]